MAKQTKKDQVQDLLNQIYSQPDLQGGVFEYVSPHILKSYHILKQDELAKDSGAEVVFKDVEHKIDVENILFRDLPSIIDMYSQMPLEYRNKHLLKGDKTHRQVLLDNLQLLTDKLQSTEKEAYADYDTAMNVKSRVFKDKYVTDFSNATQTEQESIYTSDNYKLPPTKQLKDFDMNKLENADFQKKVVLHEDQIQYKVKDKFRTFMAGTYQTFAKIGKGAKKAGSVALKYATWNELQYGDYTLAAMALVINTFAICAVAGGSSAIYLAHQRDNMLQPTNDMVFASENIDISSKDLQKISLTILNEKAKEKGFLVKYEGSEVVLSQTENREQCEVAARHLPKDTHVKSGMEVSINGTAIKAQSVVTKDMASAICNNTENTVEVRKSLKLN